MVDYHIVVRDYHWSHQNIVVQSPIPSLDTPAATLIVRPLKGVNKHEPRAIGNVADLTDDIQGDEYQTEAHGVFVPTEPGQTDYFPLWVPVHSHVCGENRVYIVNLTSFEASYVPIANVCWVPGFEAPDGTLFTVLAAPRMTLRVMMVLVVVQHIGSPAGAKLALVDPDILAKYKKIDESRKRRLFELQCWAIRVGFGRASFFPRDAYRVYSSPDRFGHGRRTLDEVLADNVGVYQPSHSDSSSQASFDSSSSSSGSSDDDSLYPTSTHTSQVEVSSRRYTCDCKFPGLLPTYYDPQPSHRHIADSECWHGSSHTKHCVFADHTPNECVVSSSDELHRHCKVRTLEDDLNDISGRYCFAEADAIYEDAELARSESN